MNSKVSLKNILPQFFLFYVSKESQKKLTSVSLFGSKQKLIERITNRLNRNTNKLTRQAMCVTLRRIRAAIVAVEQQ
jgi:hypothetical protein